MFEEDYKAAFSKVTASEDTYRRIIQMTKKQKPHRFARSRGFLGKVLVAAVMVSLLAVTASAAEEIEDYFYRVFAKGSRAELSEGQMQYIAENTQTFPRETSPAAEENAGPVSTRPDAAEGYRVTVDAALADEKDAYLHLTLTAPEGVTLDADDYCFDTGSSLMRDGRWISLLDASGLMADTEPTGNSVKLYCAFRLANERYGTFGDGQPVTLVLKNLEEVRKTDGKEERKLLSEEVWEIPITFQADSDAREVLTEPVDCQMRLYGGEADSQAALETITARLISLELAPLSAEIRYELPGYQAPKNQSYAAELAFLTVVMEDGEEVRLVPRNVDADGGKLGFSANGPILLDAVSYLLLPDGTEIPMPE